MLLESSIPDGAEATRSIHLQEETDNQIKKCSCYHKVNVAQTSTDWSVVLFIHSTEGTFNDRYHTSEEIRARTESGVHFRYTEGK